MIKKFLLFAIASLVMLAALADKPDPKPDKGNKDKPGVPLDVVFRDDPGDKFGSDVGDSNIGSGQSYLDGVEPVGAHIGKFRFGLGVGVSGTRNFFLDLTGCYELPSEPPMSCDEDDLPALRGENGTGAMGFTTGANVFATSPDRAHYLTMIDGATKEVDFQLVFLDAGDNEWRIMFNPSKCPKALNGVELATMATVTRRTEDDTWVFHATDGTDETDEVNRDVACLQLREGGAGNWEFHGLYHLPFQIEATAQ